METKKAAKPTKEDIQRRETIEKQISVPAHIKSRGYLPGITFQTIRPAVSLKEYVQCFRVAQHMRASSPLEVKTCPSGFPGIVFQVAVDGSSPITKIATRSHTISNLPNLFAHGVITEPSIIHFTGSTFYTIQVVFKPYGLHTLLGLDMSRINGLLQASQFAASDLEDRLRTLSGAADALRKLERFLIGHISSALPADQLTKDAFSFIEANTQEVNLQSMLLALGATERNIQKHFAFAVGCTPGQYIRTRRMNEALRLIRSGRYQHLSDVAYVLGYYDQSHFIRDIKTLSWLTPKAISQKVSDFQHDKAGVSYF